MGRVLGSITSSDRPKPQHQEVVEADLGQTEFAIHAAAAPLTQ